MTASNFDNEPHVKRLKKLIERNGVMFELDAHLSERLEDRSRAIKDLSRLPAVWQDTVSGNRSPLSRTHHLLVEEIRVLDDEIVVLQNAIEDRHAGDLEQGQ